VSTTVSVSGHKQHHPLQTQMTTTASPAVEPMVVAAFISQWPKQYTSINCKIGDYVSNVACHQRVATTSAGRSF